MINSLNRIFDYSGFEKKIRHYFTDSAPIAADITLGLREVHISNQSKGTVSCGIDEKLSVVGNVKNIVDACIDTIYPKMIVSEKETIPFTDEQKKVFLMRGFSVEQIHDKEQRRSWVRYILVRFNEHRATIDYVEESTKTRYRAHLYKPLVLSVKDNIWKLASGGRGGMEELYRYLMSISKQEVLKYQSIDEEGMCDIQEFS
jgi:hypothetical protein